MEKGLKSGIISAGAIVLGISIATFAGNKNLEVKANNKYLENINLKNSFNKIRENLRPASYYMPIDSKNENLNPETDNIRDWVLFYRDGSIDTLYGQIDERGKLIYNYTRP